VVAAVFLDRDGVLNELVLNPGTGDYESPRAPEDLKIAEGILAPMKALASAGFGLFLVSNQPSHAKGKTTLENIREIHRRLDIFLRDNGVAFVEYYYCYHHPRGVVPGYSGPCPCRKPSPFFLLKAQRERGVDPSRSWMIGDQDTDIECGRNAGCRTALLLNERSAAKRGGSRPDITGGSLAGLVGEIIKIHEGAVSRDERSEN